MMGIHLIDFSVINYLSHFQRYYPGIVEWYDRIKNEVVSGRRSVFASWTGSEIQGLAITKNGINSKLCHISVSPFARDRGLGSTLMSLALSDMVDNGAQAIHVTTDEEVFRNYGNFFRRSGFALLDWQLNRYRRGNSELIWKIKVEINARRYNEPESPSESRIQTQLDSISSRINTLTRLRKAIQSWKSPSSPNNLLARCDFSSLSSSHFDVDHLSPLFACKSDGDGWLPLSEPLCHLEDTNSQMPLIYGSVIKNRRKDECAQTEGWDYQHWIRAEHTESDCDNRTTRPQPSPLRRNRARGRQ